MTAPDDEQVAATGSPGPPGGTTVTDPGVPAGGGEPDPPPADPPVPTPARRRVLRRLLPWAVAAAVAALALTMPGVRHQLSLSFTHQPDRFTELWVEDEPVVTPGDENRATVTFHFTVANHEARPMVYPWTVTVDDGTVTTRAKTGSSTVADEGRATVEVTVPVTAAAIRQRITVRLDGRPETVHVAVKP